VATHRIAAALGPSVSDLIRYATDGETIYLVHERTVAVIGMDSQGLRIAATGGRIRPNPPSEKTCTDCGQTKPVTGFLPIRTTKTGH